jgi:hypothetical protein
VRLALVLEGDQDLVDERSGSRGERSFVLAQLKVQGFLPVWSAAV